MVDGQCARRAIAEAKHRSQWPVLVWVTRNLLSRAPPCFGRHVKPLVPVAFAIVSTHCSFRRPVVKIIAELYHNIMKNMLYR
jgi:hypothetical protein